VRATVRHLKWFCASEPRVRFARTGMFVVVEVRAAELPRLEALAQRAAATGVRDLALIYSAAVRQAQPGIAALAALHAPHKASVAVRDVAAALERRLGRRRVVRQFEIGAVEPRAGGAVRLLPAADWWQRGG